MQRIIPGKTKVSIELFKGVTIGDLIVAGIGMILVLLVLLSNLPAKVVLVFAIAAITAVLLVRIDNQPNYMLILHILTFFGYSKHFGRHQTDEMLSEINEKGEKQAILDYFFGDGENEGHLKRIEVLSETQQAEKKAAGKAELRASKAERRREDKILKSKSTSDEEKEAILAKREASRNSAYQASADIKDANTDRKSMENIIPFTGIDGGYIEYLGGKYYGSVIEIEPVEFRFFSENRRQNSIENCLGRILRTVHADLSANIVKLERPVLYDRYIDREYDKLEALSDAYENGVLTENELKARVEVEYDRINELIFYNDDAKVIGPSYYLVLFESDRRQLEVQIRDAIMLLQQGELTVRRLMDRELAVFLKYTNQLDFDEREVKNIRYEDLATWAMPNTVDIRQKWVEINHIITHNFRVVNYPIMVGDAWLAGVLSMPGTKTVIKCRPMDRGKAIRNIDHSLTELRAQWQNTGIDSKRLEIETHIATLQNLLTTLQNDSESIMECNIYVSAYDITATRNNVKIMQPAESELPVMVEMKKNVRRIWQESGFRLNNMEFDQVQAFIGSQVSAYDPLPKEGRGISSNTIAACFPWIYAHISDEGGIKLGESDGMPVFIDFFRRDSERVNSNMVIVGKSGSGKSYATKSLLTNLAADDAKIYILDPENEYSDLAANLHGQIINVGNAMYGRLNPFHIITALDDDEAGEGGPSGSYATHLQFLEEFFRQIMPDCEKDAMEYLNTLVDHMYLARNITADTDLSKLRPEDYPIFDDLYDEVLQEFQSTDNVFTRDLLRSLMNYISKFSTGGRNANIWNGPSTITTDENFTVFNFQSMLANRNQTIANAQMLLVLKYLDNEIIKNRDYNIKYNAKRKIVIVIDEAHVFIDAKFPIALDFMFQLAKRIRKYNGMQIVITQNIKDFVGSEELARKSTAIINACQYSFIFALAPNDMQDLVMLYEKAGGINESEQEQIVQAPRGQAFAIMSANSRSTFMVDTAEGIVDMFENHDYQSRYFCGEQGAANWEQFVGVSRAAHEASIAESGKLEIERDYSQDLASQIEFNVFEEDEYEEYEREQAEKSHSSGVSLNIIDESEEAAEAQPEEPVVSNIEKIREVESSPSEKFAAMISGGGSDVFGMIASALSRLADAAEGGKAAAVPALAAAAAGSVSAQSSPAPEFDWNQNVPANAETNEAAEKALREKEAEIKRIKAEQNEEIRRLQEELAKLRQAPQPEEEEEDLSVFAGLDDDDYTEEEDGALSDILLETSDEDEYEDDDEDDFSFTDDKTFASEDEDEEDEEEDDEDDDEDDDDDFMTSFCNFARQIMNMTAFEKMRANGKEVAPITLEELTVQIEADREQKRNSLNTFSS